MALMFLHRLCIITYYSISDHVLMIYIWYVELVITQLFGLAAGLVMSSRDIGFSVSKRTLRPGPP